MHTPKHTSPDAHSLPPQGKQDQDSLSPLAWNELVREVEVIERRFTCPTPSCRAWASVVLRIDRLLRYASRENDERIAPPPVQ
ncbi:hypothetical protein [Neolewinella maritima]|uniref:hypothetical protein n=1 Tax=Neolewinella maritima TaxID=1383882 RepID=UPI001EE7BC75|nr:hypothetical protein [Neolewinella maritima]